MVALPVVELWRYPVKSMQGERLDATTFDEVIPGDRGWGIVDHETGHLMSAKRYPLLLRGSARVDDGACVITLPDGTVTSDRAPDVNDVLSSWLERRVTLETPQPDTTMAIDIEWDDGDDEPGELAVFDFPTQPGRFHDSTSAIHIISTATLAHLEREVGTGAGDVRRFRPNIVVEADDPFLPFIEEAWVDQTLAVGSGTAWVKKPTDRCAVITREQATFPASRDTLRYLARTNGRNAGVSAQPRRAGTVAVGDTIAAVSAPA